MRKFKFLRFSAFLFKIVACAALGVGLIGAVGVFIAGGTPEAPKGAGLLVLIVAALYFALFYTIGEIVQLLLALEERTRKP